jgi:hypothetical protein
VTCTVSTATINSQADATSIAGCDTVAGSVEISPMSGAALDISGPKEITGSLTVANNPMLLTLTSTTLQTIGQDFTMNNVTAVTTLDLGAITSVNTINWQSVPQLQTLNFGDGINKVESLTISDSFLSSLTGFTLQTIGTLDINNNGRLANMTLPLTNLSQNLIIQANGQDLSVSLPNAIWIANMTIANVTSFSAPLLETVNGSMAFDSNYFQDFLAPNLTSTTSGDISFVDNGNMQNLSFPLITFVGGGILIANNTGLGAINGFPNLQTIRGAVKLRGSFNDIEFPELTVVNGAFDASSTADILPSCNTLKAKAPTNQGGNNDIQGTFSCTANNATANSDTGGGTSTTGNTGSSGSSGNSSMAAGLTVNHALLGLVAAGGFAQALW